MRAFLAVFLSVAFLAACAKKDDSFAAQYAKNAAGATAVDATTIKQTIDAAGVMIDVLEMRTTATSPMSFAARIAVGDQISTVQMVQSAANPTAVQTGTVTMGNYQVQLSGACSNATDCNPYYLMGVATLSGQPKIQIGFKFFRLEATSARDVYQVLDAAHILTFPNMVLLLNTK